MSNKVPQSLRAYPFGECRVCGARATGVHYGVETCEGCKGFYKRSLEKYKEYRPCQENGCSITHTSRIRCKACRFRRCQEVGMSLKNVRMGRIPNRLKEKVCNDTGSDLESLSAGTESETVGQTHVSTTQKALPKKDAKQKKTRRMESTKTKKHFELYNQIDEKSECLTKLEPTDTFPDDQEQDGVSQPLAVASIPCLAASSSQIPLLLESSSSEVSDEELFAKSLLSHLVETVKPQVIENVFFRNLIHHLSQHYIHPHSDDPDSHQDIKPDLSTTDFNTFLESSEDIITTLKGDSDLLDMPLEGNYLPKNVSFIMQELDKMLLSFLSAPLISQHHETVSFPFSAPEFHCHLLSENLKHSILNRLLLGHRLSCHSEYRFYIHLQTKIEKGCEMQECLPAYTPLDTAEKDAIWQDLLDAVVIFSKKLACFVLQIPGIRSLPNDVLSAILGQGMYDFWILSVHRLFYNSEFHGYTVRGRKYCTFWMKQFIPLELITCFVKLSDILREYEFSDAEVTVLLVYRLTDPNICLKNQKIDATLQRLHQFYYDLLLWAIHDGSTSYSFLENGSDATHSSSTVNPKEKASNKLQVLCQQVIPLLDESSALQRRSIDPLTIDAGHPINDRL